MIERFMNRIAGARLPALAVAAVAALLGGCAGRDTGANEPWDPIEGANRFVFSINRAVDIIAIRPIAVLYRDWMPPPAQRGLHNVLENLGEPVTAIAEVVQGTPGRAGTTLARFLVNSTIGIAGLFDVASAIGLPKTKEGFGNTIGYYAGVEPENGGFYIVLPMIGPSNARDGVGMAIDASIDPFSIVTFSISSTAGWVYAGARFGATVVDTRSRTLYALVEPRSCFAGTLAELAFAADRTYMLALDDAARAPKLVLSPMNFGAYPMVNGQSRLGRRLSGDARTIEAARGRIGESLDAREALASGLVTATPDDIDWPDEIRIALEERAAMSPDALTGLEANLRFGGAETMQTRIFGRLTAWQNWIFQRPNAVGEKGALKVYGKGEKAAFDWKRV